MKPTRHRDALYWLGRFETWLAHRGVEVRRGDQETKDYLANRSAEAAVIESVDAPPLVLFAAAVPSISSVLEEVAHVYQVLARRFAGLPLREMQLRREIEVHECLGRNADVFELPDQERATTLGLLEQDREALAEIEEAR